MSDTRDPAWPDHALAWVKSLSPAQKMAIAEILKDTPQGAGFVHLCYQAVLPTLDERNAHTRATEGAELARQAIDWLLKPQEK